MATERGRRGNECRRLPVFFPSDHINKTGNDRNNEQTRFPSLPPSPRKKKERKTSKAKKGKKASDINLQPFGRGCGRGEKEGGREIEVSRSW